jgi:hypothetical protein
MLTWEDLVSGLPRPSDVLTNYHIIRRHVVVLPFEPNKIAHAMMKSFMAAHGVLAFAQRICSGWLHGLWRAIKPSKVSAHAVDRAVGLDRPLHVAPQQGQFRQQRFFGNSKSDMRNAP